MSESQKSFLNLLYSLCKQYISWYDREIKAKEKDFSQTQSMYTGSNVEKSEQKEIKSAPASLQYKAE